MEPTDPNARPPVSTRGGEHGVQHISSLRAADVIGDRTEIYALDPSDSVEVAAQKLKHWRVRTIAVCDDVGNVAGIFGQSDIASRVVACGLDPKSVTVREAMTREPVCVDVETDVLTCVRTMRRNGISHVVLTRTNAEGEQYFGMISANDVLGVIGRLESDSSAWFKEFAEVKKA
ncbi:MAG TPA: CBS domain-containing protein [Blastocatellia bacterium]|nr:CBS domain-containing protein [Blastocatellia bacterium]